MLELGVRVKFRVWIISLRYQTPGYTKMLGYKMSASRLTWVPDVSCLKLLNNFIHLKSGSNEYKDKQTNITQLTLSSTYIYRNIMVIIFVTRRILRGLGLCTAV